MSPLDWLIAGVLAPVLFFLALVLVVVAGYARRALYFWRFPPAERIGVGRFARLLVFETLALARAVAWWLRRRGERVRGGAGMPVALIHGLSADGTSLSEIRVRLAAQGRATTSPHLGHMMRPIERYAERLAAELSLIEGTFDVVAHSMGGVVLRQTLVIEPALRARIRRVVTIASPHEGTGSARFIPTPEARQLVPGSEWLRTLPSLRELLPHAALTTIATDTDAIVYPSSTSRVDGATHHQLEGLGHTETLLHPRVLQLVEAALT